MWRGAETSGFLTSGGRFADLRLYRESGRDLGFEVTVGHTEPRRFPGYRGLAAA